MYYSFIMLKPDAIEQGLTVPILMYLKNAGIEIEMIDCQKVNTGVLLKHYAEAIAKMGHDFERKYADYFTNRYVIPIIVKSEQPDIIDRIRKVVGATNPAEADKGTIRGDFGTDSFEKSAAENRGCHNLIHASDSSEAVRREIALWFGEEYAEKYAT